MSLRRRAADRGRQRARCLLAIALVAAILAAPRPAIAQAPPAPERSTADTLVRLAEILGAIHHLREVCSANEGSIWRDQMSAVLAAEAPGGQNRSRLISAFNNAYRGFQRTYSSCTGSARTAADRFLAEGSEIASALAIAAFAPPPAAGDGSGAESGAGEGATDAPGAAPAAPAPGN